jgi:hypothetical protein
MADLSGSITSGGTAQTIGAFNPARQGLIFQVPDTEEVVWLSFGGTAAAASPAIAVQPGQTLTFGKEFRELIVRPISVFGATTGKKYTAFDSAV